MFNCAKYVEMGSGPISWKWGLTPFPSLGQLDPAAAAGGLVPVATDLVEPDDGAGFTVQVDGEPGLLIAGREHHARQGQVFEPGKLLVPDPQARGFRQVRIELDTALVAAASTSHNTRESFEALMQRDVTRGLTSSLLPSHDFANCVGLALLEGLVFLMAPSRCAHAAST